jgi:nitrate/TMAO reductase-like tetraheme cytochrome c subunit
MKLITKKESDIIFDNNSTEFCHYKHDDPEEYKQLMSSVQFNEAVNKMLLDSQINNKLLQRVKKIKDNPNLLDKELKDYFDNNHKL